MGLLAGYLLRDKTSFLVILKTEYTFNRYIPERG